MTLALANIETPETLAVQLKVTVDAKALRQALQLVTVIAKNGSSLLLKNIRLTTSVAGLNLQATDGTTNASADVYGEIGGSDTSLSVCVQPDALRLAVPKKGTVALEVTQEFIQLGAHRIKVEDATNFPMFTIPLAAVATNLFPEDLRRVAYAMSTDSSRSTLCGCLMTAVKNKLHLACTDGHRLALLQTERSYSGAKIIIPAQIVNTILRLNPIGVLVSLVKQKVVFTLLGFGTLVVNPVEGVYPDFRVVIPRKTAGELVISREAWLRALEEIQPVAKSTHLQLVKYELVGDDRLALSASTDSQSARCEIAIEPCHEAGALAGGWGLSLPFIKEILTALTSETVRLGYNNVISQFMLSGGNEHDSAAVNVVMPARV